MREYKVRWYIDNQYQVLDEETEEQLYKGSLSDCESYIRLVKQGYL